MATPMSARETLDREFLEIRASLLSVAASFDRIDRGGEGARPLADDQRWQRLLEAVDLLQQPGPGRAERLQMLFSLPYRDDWRAAYQLDTVGD